MASCPRRHGRAHGAGISRPVSMARLHHGRFRYRFIPPAGLEADAAGRRRRQQLNALTGAQGWGKTTPLPSSRCSECARGLKSSSGAGRSGPGCLRRGSPKAPTLSGPGSPDIIGFGSSASPLKLKVANPNDVDLAARAPEFDIELAVLRPCLSDRLMTVSGLGRGHTGGPGQRQRD